MRSAVASAVLLLVATAPAAALAWETDEHACIARITAYAACANAGDATCGHADIAMQANGDGDYCNSFWFSEAGIMVSDEDAFERSRPWERCRIVEGKPGPLHWFNYESYLVAGNSHHWGKAAREHFEHFHALGKQAAQRAHELVVLYKGLAMAGGQTEDEAVAWSYENISQCGKAAVGLSSFASHYLTDSYSIGHASEPTPRIHHVPSDDYLGQKMCGMRGCVHGQEDWYKGWFDGHRMQTNLTFACPEELPGLGVKPRSVAGQFYDPIPSWRGDKHFAQAPLVQRKVVEDANRQVLEQIGQLAAGNTANDPTSPELYVTNLEMCRVVLGACCKALKDDGSGNVDCTYCDPDLPEAQLQLHCPSEIGEATDPDAVVVYVGGGKVTLGDPVWLKLKLAKPEGDTVAKEIMSDHGLTSIHADAKWDKTYDVVTRLGCTQFELVSWKSQAGKFDDGQTHYTTLNWTGNPKFPLKMMRVAAPGCSFVCGDSGVGHVVVKKQSNGDKPSTGDYPHTCTGPATQTETAYFYYWVEDARGMKTNRVLVDYKCNP